MRVHPVLRLIRLKNTLPLTLLVLIFTIRHDYTVIEVVLSTLVCFFAVSHVSSISEIADIKVDKRKLEVFDHYKLSPNPLATGEMSERTAWHISLSLLIVSLILIVILSIILNDISILFLLVISYFLINVYIFLNRGIIGNVCQSLAVFVCLLVLFKYKYIEVCTILALYTFTHNVNNQIQDYVVEKEFYRTLPVEIGVNKTRIVCILLSVIGILCSFVYAKPFSLLFVTLIPLFIIEKEKIVDRVRAINYLILVIIFLTI